MQKIQAYLSIIDPRLLHQIKGKSAEFIQAFKQYKSDSEEDFMKQFCGDRFSKEQYNKLKSRTIQELQSLLLTSSSRGGSTLKKKYDFCGKKFLIGQKLLNNGCRNEGIRVIRQAHTEAVEYNFIHLASETSSLLYHDALYYKNDSKQADLDAEQTERFLRDYQAEKRHIIFSIKPIVRKTLLENQKY
ncbi:MAG: hypothetical protein AAF990_25825 [Bacteroidota bacterium]